MKFPQVYLQAIEIAYNKILVAEVEEGRQALSHFESLNLSEFETDWSVIEKVKYLTTLHNLVLFCKEEYAIKKLKRVGLNHDSLQWFVSLKDITDQFEIIESHGIIIDKVFVLYLIRPHFIINFSRQILLWQSPLLTHDNIPMTNVSKLLQGFKNRQQYAIKTTGTPLIDINNIQEESVKESITFFTENIPALIKFSKGKTESTFLKYMIEECFDYDQQKIPYNTFLSIIYDLFRVIMPNYNFETEEEWERRAVNDDYYKTFRAKKIKKYILEKKPAIKF